MRLTIDLRDNQTAFVPGEPIEGTASWQLETPPRSVELRLFWFTRGKGTTDTEVIEKLPFDAAGEDDRRPFSFTAPDSPPSFSGKLISLVWALELVIEPGSESTRVELVISLNGHEIVLPTVSASAGSR